MRRVQRRKKSIDYILPFLILISVGIIGVLGFQLWSHWSQQGKGDVYFYIASGKARVLPYGQTDWDNAFSGSRMLLGDSLKTSTQGRVVLEFFEDTYVRLGADSAVTLTDVTNTSNRESITLNLENGMVWVKGEKSLGVQESSYEVRTTHLVVKAVGTTFEVENNGKEVVRVLDGNVKVDILIGETGKERVASTINVGVGQEITIDEAALKSFEQNQNISVLQAISDSFKDTAWFQWNIQEDESPTDFSLSTGSDSGATMMLEEDATGEVSGGLEGSMETSDSEEDNLVEDDTANDDVFEQQLAAPVITRPTSRATTTGELVISGTAPAGAAKIVVESVVDGEEDSYTLGQFKEGDTSWTYNIAERFGNIAAGENKYTVYAYDADGKKSEGATITITYEKAEEEEPEEEPLEETEDEEEAAEEVDAGLPQYGF